MDSIAFALPIRPEVEDTARRLVEEFKADHGREFDMARRQQGLAALRVWYQETPVKALVVYLEAEDLEAYALNRALAGDAHDEWLEQKIEELSGGALPVTEMIMDWDTSEGHRQVSSTR